jgi:hypothetical protein
MSTLDPMSGNPPTTSADLLTALIQIGGVRMSDHAAGGALLAAFGDFCWATGTEPTSPLFDHWVIDVYDGPAMTSVQRHAVGALLRSRG